MARYIYLLCLILTTVSCVTQKPAKPVEESVPPKPNVYFDATVIRDNINIRSTFSIDGSVMGTVNDGDQVHVLQNIKGWYEIVTLQETRGWIRSDFVGTKSMSYKLKSENFADSTLKGLNVEMFIDENDPYATIYLVLPDTYYSDKNGAASFVKELGEKYQQKVYPGKVEIRILNKDKKSVFARVDLPKKGAVNLKAPFLVQGRPFSFDLVNGNTVIIKVLIPAGLTDDSLYEMSRDISANYGNDIRKIEIFFVEDSSDGLNYLTHTGYNPKQNSTCRFYYLEDSNGPDYKSNFCN